VSGIIDQIERENLRGDRYDFEVGDLVEVHYRIQEGDRERVQVFIGTVIAKKHGGARETFTVRRIVAGEGVERIFPLHSPRIVDIRVRRRGKVRRAKLYYLRERTGKATRLKERRLKPGKEAAVVEKGPAVEEENGAAQEAGGSAQTEPTEQQQQVGEEA